MSDWNFSLFLYNEEMPLYTDDSLQALRQRIDLVEVVGSYVQLKRAGASFKALCPFHDEKTPSFVIQRGDTHYHCFGCGAHGDAIGFLMAHLKMGFLEAIESLAERFHVALERVEKAERAGPSKAELKDGLEKACQFYHFALLQTEEGHEALKYLYARGIDLDFVRTFGVGWAPKERGTFEKVLRSQGISEEILHVSGLMREAGREFFSERVTFPIRDAMGAVIGFSARKIKEEVFGGKYINTPETPLFKKSQVLFGLSYSRKRIAKERKAIVVEGQIDALRLIHAGLNFTVAGQGTAFGEGHVVQLLNLGVSRVYLAFDGDEAGQEAAVKVGDLFQKKGVEVSIVTMLDGKDPDAILKEEGPPHFLKLLDESRDYLTFLVARLSKIIDMGSPAGKNELVQTIAKKIKAWEQPVMVHESLRKLAALTSVPETVIGLENLPVTYVKKSGHVDFTGIDSGRILETDLLRWLFLAGTTSSKIVELAAKNLQTHHFRSAACAHLFKEYIEAGKRDLLAFASVIEKEEDQKILSEIMERKVNLQKAEEGIIETIKRILQRHWMEEREAIKAKIQSGQLSDDEVLELAKAFDHLNKNPPVINY